MFTAVFLFEPGYYENMTNIKVYITEFEQWSTESIQNTNPIT